ncbi:MAG TPA: VCBS repeat-containing protein [Phycisphaerales bacterium]|nr:VCBS repeat-containing protein [Phycisphaerales bacterium]HMP36520.1 VCBS repeat-containing protein [Phycisphaerales bacterium]
MALSLFAAIIAAAPSAARGQAPALAEHFGFDGLEILKIDPNPGPVAFADLDGDGHGDIVVVNNRKSRIEIHHVRPGASPDDEPRRATRPNEIPEHWRYRREQVSVNQQVTAIQIVDVDGDGLLDIVYAGRPATIGIIRQVSPGVFEPFRRHTVRDLSASRDGFIVADVIGDEAPEVIALVGGRIRIWPLAGGNLGTPIDLPGGGAMVAMLVEDFDGDGRLDIVGIIPDDPAPIRAWLAAPTGERRFGPQLRFEMPTLREASAIRLPGEAAARLGVIEAVSKRLVVYTLQSEPVDAAGTREASLRIHAFRDGTNRRRSVAVADIDGDGLDDLVATDAESNAVVLFRQVPGAGLGAAESFPAYAELAGLVAGDVDGRPGAEVFVLSEKEGVVGRMDFVDGVLTFPRPLSITPGHTPTALNLVTLEDGPRLAIIAKEGRNHVIDLVDPRDGSMKTIDLGAQSRSPETILALDADQDGRTDLLLFTPERPMTMLRSGPEGFTILESKDMGQFGLVQAAESRNTEVFDVDGDGRPELLVADRNFVRALRYEPDPRPGTSPGWQVVAQLNAEDPAAKLVSLAIRGDSIVAADRESGRLLTFARRDGQWAQTDSVDIRGFRFGNIKSGSFSGDGAENILAIGDDGFAVIRLSGDRIVLREESSWRTDVERRRQHEMAAGDINSDGFTDLIVLDDGEQMCEILTFTESNRLLYATGFKVFESRLFSGGDARESQPSQVHIADVTGDGLPDVILVSHDRLLIYPQMRK